MPRLCGPSAATSVVRFTALAQLGRPWPGVQAPASLKKEFSRSCSYDLTRSSGSAGLYAFYRVG